MDMQALAGKIDHTLLKPDATYDELRAAIAYAREIGAASVCVNPAWVTLAAGLLQGSGTAVCTVIGFPLGACTSYAKAKEAADAWLHGAEELDMVLNITALKSGDTALVKRDIAAVVSASPALVKVILETGFLTQDEIVTACRLCEEAGAAFVKTSTGFGPRGASVEDIRLMRASVSPAMKIKAAGGMATYADALAMLEAGADRLGMSRTKRILQEAPK